MGKNAVQNLAKQSLFDLALQHCGSFEAAFEMAQLNDLSLTDDLAVDAKITLPEVLSQSVVRHYSVDKIQPATGITSDELNAALNTDEGIEFWGIEFDFIVQ